MIQLETALGLHTAPLAGQLVDAPVDIGQRWPVVRTGTRPPINRTLRRLIYQRDGRRCCILDHKTRGLLELDHIIPWSAGGPDTSSNLRSACHDCNSRRSNFRTPADVPAIPVTLACDQCIRDWIVHYGITRYGHTQPGEPPITTWCGNCQDLSTVTHPARLK